MIEEEIKMMEIPLPKGLYEENIHKILPDYVWGKDMKDHITNSIYDDWCRWQFPNNIKEKIEDNKLYLVWYNYKESSDPKNLSCTYIVYYIEKVPQDIQSKIEKIEAYTKETRKYRYKYHEEF